MPTSFYLYRRADAEKVNYISITFIFFLNYLIESFRNGRIKKMTTLKNDRQKCCNLPMPTITIPT